VYKKYKQWIALIALFSAYGAVIWYFWPWSLLWSLIPTQLMAMPHTTVYQHRCMTHGALKMPDWLRNCFETIGWLCIGYNTPEWVATHKAHHKWSDQIKDPHSPRWVLERDGTYRAAQGMEGLFPAIFPFNVVSWRRWIKQNPDMVQTFAREVLRDETEWMKWMHAHNTWGLPVGITALCLITWLVHGNPLIGLGAAFVHFVGFVFIFNPLINGICHMPHKSGYQHTKAPIAATTFNNWWIALITGGEGFHHNHHWQQPSAKFAAKWYEVPADTGYMLICVLERFGVVWDVKRPKFIPV
jgi:stearoyl-CoA desaturase (Delta-9 desaturase)